MRAILYSIALVSLAFLSICNTHTDAGEEETTPPQQQRLRFFEEKIRPLLIEKCATCHSGDEFAESPLGFRSRQELVRGGTFGPAMIPGKPAESLLIQAVKWTHKELHMPPEEQDRLSRTEIDDLSKWIEDGAVWPDSDETVPINVSSGLAEKDLTTSHWSFQPRGQPEPPHVESEIWNSTEIDRFLQAAREERNLVATHLADRRTLIRRASFDLTGLPPTPDEIKRFIDDPRDDEAAYSALLDRLLASPQYGERWGRHWLDVARYADTQGDVGDFPIPKAALYRDWVIQSLNRDLPINEFLKAQIAGDILAQNVSDPELSRELTIATGFIALSRRFGNRKAESLPLTIENTIDTLGRGLLGLTLRCARCHDHRFDPVLQTDYYGLYGIFESTIYPWMGMSDEKSPSDLAPVTSDPVDRKAAQDYWNLIAHYEYQINNHRRPWLQPTLKEFRQVSESLREAREKNQHAEKLKELEHKREELLQRHNGAFRELMLHGLSWIKREVQRMAGNPPEFEMVYGVGEAKPHNARIHLRGDPDRLGTTVPRHFLQVLDGREPPQLSGSGRLELANWLVRPEHPLVARVFVNRVWYHHFGRGIVATLDDFGAQGDPPSHPQLLDWLAEQFIADGWSLKRLHRRIMLTRTYRLSSKTNDQHLSSSQQRARVADSANIYLWHFPRRRLEAEAIRDSMLAVSGELELSPAPPHDFPAWQSSRFSLNTPFQANAKKYQTRHRSVYQVTQRLFPHPVLGLFDGPDPNESNAQRSSVDVPGQALFLMNSSFVRQRAAEFADRLLASAGTNADRIQLAYQLAFGRDPDKEEHRLIEQHLRTYTDQAGQLEMRDAQRAAWTSFAQMLICSNEFIFID